MQGNADIKRRQNNVCLYFDMPSQERYAAVSNMNSIKAKSVLIFTMNTKRQSSNTTS